LFGAEFHAATLMVYASVPANSASLAGELKTRMGEHQKLQKYYRFRGFPAKYHLSKSYFCYVG